MIINSDGTDLDDLRCFFYGNAEFDYSEKSADSVNKESSNVYNDGADFDDLRCFFYEELDYSEKSADNANKESSNVYNDETDFDDLRCFFYEEFDYSEKFADSVNKESFNVCNTFNNAYIEYNEARLSSFFYKNKIHYYRHMFRSAFVYWVFVLVL